MLMRFILFLFLPLLVFSPAMAQSLYQGPAAGSVPSGTTTSTYTFNKSVINPPKPVATKNKDNPLIEASYYSFPTPGVDPMSIYVQDPNAGADNPVNTEETLLLKSFNGMTETNSIPPDPYLAVGPTHIVSTVNSNFAIYDKQGNLVQTISADTWYATTLSGPGAFDPKVLYDHYAKRWIQVWLDQSDSPQRGYFLISVSDDSIPTGTWYNWAIPSTTNGSTVTSSWGDYQGVGYDENCLYITSNQFQFGGSFQGVKIRIIKKSELYADQAGQLSWNDLWDIRYPQQLGSRVFNIRPSIKYTSGGSYPLLHAPSGGANYMVVYKINDPAGTPSMTGQLVQVAQYSNAPNANQLGGSTILLEGAGAAIRNEPKVWGDKMWAVHSVGTPGAGTYSSFHYVRINTNTMTTEHQQIYGAPGFWHIYAALEVDKMENVAVTFSRSGTTEYVGAFVAGKRNDISEFGPSIQLAAGQGNYVKDFGSGRNRWGDYNGIWLDPVNQLNMWVFTEYVARTNTWGTWFAEIRLEPYAGASIYPFNSKLNFTPVELGFSSAPFATGFANYGWDDLVVDSISSRTGQFSIVENMTFPMTLATYDSVSFNVVFTPNTAAIANDTLYIYSNDAVYKGIPISARGYEINPASEREWYAATKSGKILKLNPASGAGTEFGTGSNYNEITSVAINPKTKIAYGLSTGAASTALFRLNGTGGDAYTLYSIPSTSLTGMSFDTSGTLYLAGRGGQIYSFDLANGAMVMTDSVKTNLSGIAFDPFTNELWATVYRPVGSGRDRVVKVVRGTGDTLLVGVTGFSIVTNDIEFDENGVLYGVKGSTSQNGELFTINKTTGAGTLIGASGFNGLNSIAYLTGTLTSVKEDQVSAVPGDFRLGQNYPNPFNPETTIEYSLPVNGSVRLVVYNMLGQVINELVNEVKAAGSYKLSWNASNRAGEKLPSGIYFYELQFEGSGKKYSEMKKMVILK